MENNLVVVWAKSGRKLFNVRKLWLWMSEDLVGYFQVQTYRFVACLAGIYSKYCSRQIWSVSTIREASEI